MEYRKGKKCTYIFCTKCRKNHKFCPGYPALSDPINEKDLDQEDFERPSSEEASGRDSTTCSCCERKYNKKVGGLRMEYNCDGSDSDCEKWMCTNCAIHHELCNDHKEVATMKTLEKLLVLDKLSEIIEKLK